MLILVLNCGSATVKYKLFRRDGGLFEVLDGGTVEVQGDHGRTIAELLPKLPARPEVVAHRVVHGGDVFREPVLVDEKVLDRLERLSDLAPLHNPPALAGIEAARRLDVPQVACFDTMFHRTLPEHAWRYAIPDSVAGPYRLRRYGFHGISYQYVTARYAEITGNPKPTIVILHLGNGASAAAVRQGRSVDTSMGVTPLEGLVMGTRGGDLDPGIVLELQRRGMSLEEVERLLWHGSGLFGLTGTRDVREVLARRDERARLALEIACYRARKYVGAYLAALGGAEAIVFTGGIGERSPEIRRRILEPLAFLGVELDEKANGGNALCVTTAASRIAAYVIPTDEELEMAKMAAEAVRSARAWATGAARSD